MALPRAAAGRVDRHRRRVQRPGRGYELSKAGYDVTVAEARNRVGGRVISFSDLVAGKNVEGGGELIGSNHPAWVGYAKQFGLKFLDVSEEDLEAPIVLGGKRLTSDESDALWEEMEKAFNTIIADAAKVDADEPWKAANAEALDKRTLASWIDGLSASPLCKTGLHTMMMADNGMVTAVAELSRQPRDGQRRRPREVLDRIRGLSLPGRQPAARAQVRRGDRTDAGAHADDRALRRRHRRGRPRHARQRQGARGRSRRPHRAAAGLEPHRHRSGAAGRPRAADGHQRQVPDGRQRPFWRRAELGPRC